MKNLYKIKETCPLWSDGTGKAYERILPYIFTDKNMAEKYMSELYDLAIERVNFLEYEIIDSGFQLVENYMTFGEFEKYMDEVQEEDFTENDRGQMFTYADNSIFRKMYYEYED